MRNDKCFADAVRHLDIYYMQPAILRLTFSELQGTSPLVTVKY